MQETSHMTTDDQPKNKIEPTNHQEPYGSPLSLARIQSLVSMTLPRDGYQIDNIGTPAFVEFDLSIDGFASLFISNVFPHSFSQVRALTRVSFRGGEGRHSFHLRNFVPPPWES